MVSAAPDAELVATTFEELFIGVDSGPKHAGAHLRREDLQKVAELTPLLGELARAAGASGVLVDAAAGKAATGLLAAELVLSSRRGPWRVVMLERDPIRAAACRAAAPRRRQTNVPVEMRVGDVADEKLWPERPDLVVALHACGTATDRILDRAVAASARRMLLVPCCYGSAPTGGPRAGAPPAPPGQSLADSLAARLAVPSGLIGGRFARAIIDAERMLRLEANGYHTEVVELFSPQVSPFNLLWRARRVGEPGRMREAARRRAVLRIKANS